MLGYLQSKVESYIHSSFFIRSLDLKYGLLNSTIWGYCSLTTYLYVTDAGSLQWIVFSFSHIVFIQVNYKDVVNSCLRPVSLCPACHSNPFEVSMQMPWFKPQTFKCWVSIHWYLKSLLYHYSFINIFIFTFFHLTICCGRLYIFHTNEIYLNKTYLLTYLLTY